MLLIDDHPGGCGLSRVTGCSGVPSQPRHETVGLILLPPPPRAYQGYLDVT